MKKGGWWFEDYTEQPTLSPTTIEETKTPPIRTESRRKRIATSEESSNRELLILLKEMRDEMRGKDEQLREDLRWRETHFEEELKKKDDNLTAALQQRYNE